VLYACVSGDVREGLLDNPEGRDLDLRSETAIELSVMKVDVDAGTGSIAVDPPCERRQQAEVVQHGRLRFIDRSHAIDDVAHDRRDVLLEVPALRAMTLDPEQQASEKLANFVVQLARDLATFGFLDVNESLRKRGQATPTLFHPLDEHPRSMAGATRSTTTRRSR
jgi:hypothetical protein